MVQWLFHQGLLVDSVIALLLLAIWLSCVLLGIGIGIWLTYEWATFKVSKENDGI